MIGPARAHAGSCQGGRHAEVLLGRHDSGYRGGKTRLEEPVSAQPEHTPIPSYAPAPGAPAELLAQLHADPRAPR